MTTNLFAPRHWAVAAAIFDPSDLKPGDRVRVSPGFGTGAPVIVIVDEYHENIKNGRPGIDYHHPGGEPRSYWAYASQIVGRAD